MSEVEIGGRTVTIQRPTVSKAARIITLLGVIQKQVPEATKAWAQFRRDYAVEYAQVLDRAQALVRYPARPVFDADDNPALHDGQVVMVPSPLASISEEAWERMNQQFRMPAEPSQAELFFHMAPFIFERAERPVLRLLAVLVMDNEKVARFAGDGTLEERLQELVEEVIQPAALHEVMELLVTAAEVVDREIVSKAQSLGKRMRPMLNMLGLAQPDSKPTGSTTSSEQPERSSTDSASTSPDSSNGSPTRSSDSPGTPSTPSESSLAASGS